MVRDIIIYVVYCEGFDKVETGDVIPFYDIRFDINEKEEINISEIKRRDK